MENPNPDRPWTPRKHEDPERILNPFEQTADPERIEDEHRENEQLDPIEDPQDPPDPSEASDPETSANANAQR
ncbi:MAG TPA: hypothetical protein VGL28_10245 [Steroidobacteraceae bacterium]|jgi:hypothetical protein